eukprot:COSAG05_NODE_21302_length_273_cov_0.551724_1_plen_56_part_10
MWYVGGRVEGVGVGMRVVTLGYLGGRGMRIRSALGTRVCLRRLTAAFVAAWLLLRA